MRGRSRRLEALCRNSSFFIRFGPIFRSSGDEDERGRKVRPETVDPISLRSREFSPSSPPLHPLHEPFQRVANFMAPVGSLRAARLPPRRINTSIKIKNLQPKITSNCNQSGAGEPARSSPRRRALAGGLVPTPGDMPMPFSLLPLLLAFSTPSSHPGHQNPIRSKSRIFAAPPEPVSRRRCSCDAPPQPASARPPAATSPLPSGPISDSPSDKEAGEVLPRNRYTRPRSVLVVTQPQPLSRHKIPPTRRKEGKGEGGNAGGAKAAETELVSARSGQSTFGEFLKEPHADHARAPLPLLPRPYLATSRKAPAGSNDQLPAWRACPKTARCYYGLTEAAEKKLSTLISSCLEGATLARPSHNQMRFYIQKREREKNKLGDKKSTSGDQKSSVLTSRLVSLQI